MNNEVNDMVPDNIGTMEPIIQGKGKKADSPRRRYSIRELVYVPDKGHLADAAGVIELEGHVKGI
jgi:hypothetical protein